MMGNRTAWFPDITVQYYSFGAGAVVSTIIQGLRACGYRGYQPTVRIPTKLHKKLIEAIALENKLYSDLESWTDKNRGKYGLVVPKSQKIIQSKVANVVIEPFVTGKNAVINIEEYTGYLTKLYPLVDELSHNQLEGTREYQKRTPYVIYRDTMNIFSKARLQESRRMFVPKKDWTFPKYGELGSTIRMCSKFNYDMEKCATYYLDLETCELKIALWDVKECFEREERVRIYVKTESGQET